MTDDEREAREWLRNKADHTTHPYSDTCRTILALLDEPRLPRPEDVPKAVIDEMWQEAASHGGGRHGMEIALGVLYDHLTQPAEPKPLGWAVVDAVDHPDPVLFHDKQNAVVYSNKYGGRIVKLVEDRSDGGAA